MIRSALPAAAAAIAVAAALALPGAARAATPAPPRDGGPDSPWQIVAYLDKDMPFRPEEVPRHPAPGGFGLTVVDGLWNLVPATLEGRAPKDNPDLVAIDATPADALVYLRLPGLAAGKVDTPDMRFKGVERDLSRKSVAVPFKSVAYKFELGKKGASTLTDGVKRQLVAEGWVGDENSPERDERSVSLLWAGDLDHDGKLDFIISDWFDDGGTMCVWLSSRAAPGQLAGKAACMDRSY